MPRFKEPKYGSADHTRVWVCPENHVHLLGMSPDDEIDYEIVLGEALFVAVEESIAKARADKPERHTQPNPTH